MVFKPFKDILLKVKKYKYRRSPSYAKITNAVPTHTILGGGFMHMVAVVQNVKTEENCIKSPAMYNPGIAGTLCIG